jgi:rhomboid protease GluP
MRVPVQQVVVRLPKSRPAVTYVLMGFSIFLYALQYLSQSLFNGNDILFLWGGKINVYILQGELWRLITPVFLHGSILHIAFNMYALFLFGPELERAYGHARFLVLYLLGGFAGNVLSFALSSAASLGSSTAIFGLVSAEAVFVYQNRKIIGQRTRSILINLLVIVVINLALGFAPGAMIDNWGHLGGLLGGALFAWLAGPKWGIEGLPPEFKIVDRRPLTQVQIGVIAVLAVFSIITVIRFLY